MFEKATKQMTTSQNNLAKSQAQLAQGKQIINPSDAPDQASTVQRLKSILNRQESYQSSLNTVKNRLQGEESTLQSVSDLLVRAKEVAVQGANDTLSAGDRKALGTEICNHQAIAFKLADMATDIEAARHMVMKAAWDKDQGVSYDTSSAMAKLFASRIAMEHTVEAVQIHGGNGFVKDYHVERLMRDAKITQIYEGTSEIQKMVISRAVLKG